MKNAIYRMESLSPFDLQGTAEHLSAMAAKGWRLEKIGRYFWKYQRAEAAYIHYAVTCPPAAEENGDMGDRLFFQELCSAAGWEVVTDWASLQIYANPAEIPTPLETDEALRLEMIHQSMRRTYLRDHRNQLFCFVVLLIFTLTQLFRFPHSYCLSGLGLSLPPFCLLSLFGEAYAIAGYNLWLRRSRRLVEEGGGPAAVPRFYRVLSRLSVILTGVLFLALVFTLFPLSRPSAWTALAALLALAFGVLFRLLDGFLQRRGASREFRFFTALVLFFLCLLPAGFENFRPFGFLDEPSYTWNSQEWDAEPQPLPLTVETLTGQSWPHVRRSISSHGRTPLAAETAYSEAAAQENGKEAYLNYIILDVPNDFVYRAILDDMLRDTEFFIYQPSDPVPWGADAAYRRVYRNGTPSGDQLLCYSGRILTVYTEGLPVDDIQKALIAARLAPNS